MASQDAVDQIIEKYGREENKDEKHPLVKTVVCRLSALCTVPVSPMGRIFLSQSPVCTGTYYETRNPIQKIITAPATSNSQIWNFNGFLVYLS